MDVFLWDDDASGAYLISKYIPAVAGAFSYVIMNLFLLSIRDIFGFNTSPADYEPLARAIAFLFEYLSMDDPLVITHAEIINLVDVDVEFDPSKVAYNQAIPDTTHKSIYNISKRRDVNTPRNPFMDDTLITETRYHMSTFVAAIIEALYVVLDYEKLSERRSSFSMDKFDDLKYYWE